jgi:hypothetical protein
MFIIARWRLAGAVKLGAWDIRMRSVGVVVLMLTCIVTNASCRKAIIRDYTQTGETRAELRLVIGREVARLCQVLFGFRLQLAFILLDKRPDIVGHLQ